MITGRMYEWLMDDSLIIKIRVGSADAYRMSRQVEDKNG